jgi:tetratricopeptide (TPR) repeat protein
MRYALPLAPWLALLVGGLAGRLVGSSCRYCWLGWLAVVVLVAQPLYASVHIRMLLGGRDSREQARGWLERHAPQSQYLVELPSKCGRIQVLTPRRVLVRQTHYLLSYGQDALLRAYWLLARRDDLPPLYLELGEDSGRLRQRRSSAAPDSSGTPVVLVRYQHPVCPEVEISPEVRKLLEAHTQRQVFSPGRVEAAIFDRMDWYFLPVAGFDQVGGTGPVVQLDLLSLSALPQRLEAKALFDALYWALRGHLARSQKDWKGALQAYERIMETPIVPEELLGIEIGRYLYIQLGRTHAQLGNRDKMLFFMEKVVALKPTSATTYNELGTAYAASGALEKAVRVWDELVAQYPDFAPAYFNLGRALMRLGRHQRAKDCWLKGLELMPDHPQAERIQQMLKKTSE